MSTMLKKGKVEMQGTHRPFGLTLILAIGALAVGSAWALPASDDGVVAAGKVAKASRGFPSVVMLVPAANVSAPAPTEPALLNQVNKAFEPSMLLVRVGQPVMFRNGEALLHNVHLFDLANDETVLNVAQPIEGWTTDYVFEQAGAYAVLCDVHPEMEAYIVVVDTPYATVADADGSFEIMAPPGDYTLKVWSVNDKKRRQEKVRVPAEGLEFR